MTEARGAIEEADSATRAAREAIASAEANARAQQARLRTIKTGRTSEEIDVARARVTEAEESLGVTREQAGDAFVTAPFAGTVTAINTEPGQAVGERGVLSLVSDETEIRLDVDEINLADLRLNQAVTISSSAFPDNAFRGRVSEVAPAVNEQRGTIQVTVTPLNPPEWLRPGQTVNVNIITGEAERLLVPAEAISRIGDHSIVFVVEEGRTIEKTILTRPPTRDGVPVLAGISFRDRIIANVAEVKAGSEVRIKS